MTSKLMDFFGRREVFLTLLCLVISVFGIQNLLTVRNNIENPPVWDFQIFWLFGRSSAQGLNPYLRESLIAVATPAVAVDQMIEELYFFYPPPTLFLFAPLGWFEDIHTAYAVWYIILGAILILDVLLLWRMFIGQGMFGLVLTLALVLLFFPTRSNIVVGQINFLMLLAVLLFWRDRNKTRSGMWLALGIIIKPIMAILILYALLQRQWRSLVACILALVGISLVTILVYGPELFLNYFIANPVSDKMPDYLYVEMGNQSLLGVILRAVNYDFASGPPLFYLPFVISASITTGITVWRVYRLETAKNEIALSLVIILALLIYPKALWHYSFILLAPLFYVWRERSDFLGKDWGTGLFIAVNYVLVYVGKGNFTFVALLLMWIVFISLSLRNSNYQYKKHHQLQPIT